MAKKNRRRFATAPQVEKAMERAGELGVSSDRLRSNLACWSRKDIRKIVTANDEVAVAILNRVSQDRLVDIDDELVKEFNEHVITRLAGMPRACAQMILDQTLKSRFVVATMMRGQEVLLPQRDAPVDVDAAVVASEGQLAAIGRLVGDALRLSRTTEPQLRELNPSEVAQMLWRYTYASV